MKKYLFFALPFCLIGLLLLPPQISQAKIATEKGSQVRSVQSANASKTAVVRKAGQKKKKTAKASSVRKKSHGIANKHKAGAKSKKTTGKRRAALKYRGGIDEAPFADASGLDELRQHYLDWRGTRYRAGGTSRAGVDCSGFTALTFREVYGVNLPRTAREQAMRGMPIDRDGLLPGDLVFFKRRGGGDHVGIYIGNNKFMHASSHRGVIISSMQNAYWRNKFWKGTRL